MLGDAQQRVVGLVLVGGREEALVRRDQGQVEVVGDVEETSLGLALFGEEVTLQLDIKPARKERGEPSCHLPCFRLPAL